MICAERLCASYRMDPPGVSYTPRDFMPTSRFSVSNAAHAVRRADPVESLDELGPGSSSPSTLTGSPFSKPTLTTSLSSGASSGRTAVTRQFAGGLVAGSSISAPSWLMCQRLRSRL